MLTHTLGFPRIGANRNLKKVTESYWRDEIDQAKLVNSISALKAVQWTQQKNQSN